MLLWLLDSWFASQASALEKITFRAALAALVSFALAILLGPRLIAWLNARFREPIVSASQRIEQLHRQKQWTPTMGGLFIVAGIVGSALVFGDLANRYLQLCLLLAVALAALGAVDDLAKLRTRSRGIGAKVKFLAQLAIAGGAALGTWYVHGAVPGGLDLRVPLAGVILPLGWLFVPLAVLVIVGASNAVNLTDGLDGLAGGSLVFATAGMGTMAYVGGHAALAVYLDVPHIPAVGETAVVAGGMVGGLLGFLWFNCHPAQVFMGDTGSLPLGGLLGMLAICCRQELLLVVVGGVFVAEAASVILQVGYYKCTQRRIFLCAPLHHHFQFRGWPESRIVVRFWIASALCAILGVAGVKLTVQDQAAAPAARSIPHDGPTLRFADTARPKH